MKDSETKINNQKWDWNEIMHRLIEDSIANMGNGFTIEWNHVSGGAFHIGGKTVIKNKLFENTLRKDIKRHLIANRGEKLSKKLGI